MARGIEQESTRFQASDAGRICRLKGPHVLSLSLDAAGDEFGRRQDRASDTVHSAIVADRYDRIEQTKELPQLIILGRAEICEFAHQFFRRFIIVAD